MIIYMKILSIDIGIKNLAFCLFDQDESGLHIRLWDTVDISEKEDAAFCGFIEEPKKLKKQGKKKEDKEKEEKEKEIQEKEEESQKMGVCCNKPAKFKGPKIEEGPKIEGSSQNIFFCLKHAKKQTAQKIPTKEQSMQYLSKQKISTVLELANHYDVAVASPSPKKAHVLAAIGSYISANYLQPIEQKKGGEVDLFHIGINIQTKFDKIFANITEIDHVIIENQIGPLAIRMKTIQGMIVQYFIMSPIIVKNIEFISAANKLKVFTNTKKDVAPIANNQNKLTYSDRKKAGIQRCLGFIDSNPAYQKFLDYFHQHKKKDDLADSFLQGIWFIQNKKLF